MRGSNDVETMDMELLAMDAENSVADTTGKFWCLTTWWGAV